MLSIAKTNIHMNNHLEERSSEIEIRFLLKNKILRSNEQIINTKAATSKINMTIGERGVNILFNPKMSWNNYRLRCVKCFG